MNLCRNIAAVVGFFLALTLFLSLAVGTVEYPPAIALESATAPSISEYTVYTLKLFRGARLQGKCRCRV